MAKCALRYLKHTMDMELCYNGNDVNGDLVFHGFSDADWSGDIDTSHSTSGYMFITNHGAIGWASKRQSMVALSTTESEYSLNCWPTPCMALHILCRARTPSITAHWLGQWQHGCHHLQQGSTFLCPYQAHPTQIPLCTQWLDCKGRGHCLLCSH